MVFIPNFIPTHAINALNFYEAKELCQVSTFQLPQLIDHLNIVVTCNDYATSVSLIEPNNDQGICNMALLGHKITQTCAAVFIKILIMTTPLC